MISAILDLSFKSKFISSSAKRYFMYSISAIFNEVINASHSFTLSLTSGLSDGNSISTFFVSIFVMPMRALMHLVYICFTVSSYLRSIKDMTSLGTSGSSNLIPLAIAFIISSFLNKILFAFFFSSSSLSFSSCAFLSFSSRAFLSFFIFSNSSSRS